MPDLGPHAASVLSAYGVTLLLLGGLTLRILARAARAKAALAKAEKQTNG